MKTLPLFAAMLMTTPALSAPLLPPDWNPKQAADRVLTSLVKVTAPEVKGAHDSDMIVSGERAFVVYMAKDVQPGEAASWPFI